MKKFLTEFIKKDIEVTRNKYFYMLEVLPPTRMVQNAFLAGEPMDHNAVIGRHCYPRYELYFMEDGKCYYGGLATVPEFDSFIINHPL